jgi:MFS family permease
MFRRENFIQRLASLPASVKRVSFLLFLYAFGWAIAQPFWAIYFKEKLVFYSLTGIALAFMPFLQIFWVLFWGTIIDRFQKRKIMAVMLLLYLPFSFLVLALQNFTQVIIFFIYHSFISTSFWLALETYLRGHSPRDKAAESFGLFDTLWGLAYITGPVIGGLLFTQFSYGIFLSISIMALIAFFVALSLPDHDHNAEYELPPKKTIMEDIKDWWQNVNLRRFTLLVASLSLSTSFLGMLLPLLSKEIGAQAWQIGILVALTAIPSLFESYFSTLALEKKRLITMLSIGAILFLMLTLAKDIYLLFIINIALAISITSVYPVIQGKITTAMPRKIVGPLTSITFAIGSLAAALGPLLGGIVSDLVGIHYVFFVGFAIFAGIILYLLFCKKFEIKT